MVPVVRSFMGNVPHRGNEIAHMWDCLMETVNDQDFLFCAFQVKDWNGDFSPWKSPAASEMMISKEMVQRLYNG